MDKNGLLELKMAERQKEEAIIKNDKGIKDILAPKKRLSLS